MKKHATDTTQAAHVRVARSVALVGFLLAVDKLLGVAREAVVSRTFGATAEMDAYIAAFEIPEGLNVIVTGAALTTALIPLLAAVVDQEDEDSVWRLFSTVINWVLTTVGLACIISALLARPIILTVAPGFADNAHQVALATRLMYLVLIQTLVFSLSTIVTSALQAHQHFLLPALSPLFYTLGRIFGALVLAPRLETGIFGLAWGGLIGAAIHLAVKVPWLIRHRARWMLVWRHPQFKKLLELMGPRMLGMGVTYVSFVLPTTLGSQMFDGAIAAYEYGWKLMQLPETIIATAVGIVVFPTLARIAERGERENLRQTFSWALRLVLTLCIPAAVGLLVLGRPLSALVLQGGAFDAQATERVYRALQFFALGLVTHGMLEVVARLFYAQRDMWTPLWAAIGGLAVNVGTGLLLRARLAHAAIALGNSLGVGLQVAVLLLVTRRRLDGLEGRRLGRMLLQTGTASLMMGGAVIGFRTLLAGAGQGAVIFLQQTITAVGLEAIQAYVPLAAHGIGGLLVGGAVYLLVALGLGNQEIRELPQLMLGQQREKPAKSIAESGG